MLQRFQVWTMPLFTPVHVRVYRAFGGRVGNRTPAGGQVVLLTTTGRRSGKQRTVALGCLEDDDALYVVASNGGKRQEPGWIHNIRANSSVHVQFGADRFATEAEVTTGADREEIWERYTAAFPDYADAERWAGRKLPVVRLRRPQPQ